jgi:hypothetical protein
MPTNIFLSATRLVGGLIADMCTSSLANLTNFRRLQPAKSGPTIIFRRLARFLDQVKGLNLSASPERGIYG